MDTQPALLSLLRDQVTKLATSLVERLEVHSGGAWLLCVLAAIDLDPSEAERRQKRDEHKRKGVLSWQQALEELRAQGHHPEIVASAISGLWNWGLIQVIGQSAKDPLIPGTAAIRLTHSGRAALGLSPLGVGVGEPTQVPQKSETWNVWHGASREGLLWEARAVLGHKALRPLRVLDGRQNSVVLIGQIVLTLQKVGFVVLDAFGLKGAKASHLIEEVLYRTGRARGQRLLLVGDPSIARVAALTSEAVLRWVELPLHGSQHIGFYDVRVTQHLREGHARAGGPQADVCGMPESDRAMPRRPGIRWDDMLFAPSVQHQMEQALSHARFRTHHLSGGDGFAGQGAGYRLLLSGVPGTGKSMAAEALADALDRSLLTLDLSAVLSRWLGETEKFLAQVFEMAELSGCVLLLDEAESLFRQREGDDGGSSAMQTVVSFLLSRLEAFRGVLVATTNRVKDLDEAFFRRFDDFVIVPIPEPAIRRQMWIRMLDLTPPNPEIDLDILAERFAISGGLIRGAAIRARAWAQQREAPLNMPLILAALGRELEKSDRSAANVFLSEYRAEVMRHFKGPGADIWG